MTKSWEEMRRGYIADFRASFAEIAAGVAGDRYLRPERVHGPELDRGQIWRDIEDVFERYSRRLDGESA